MTGSENGRQKPALPHINDRRLRLQMRKVGRRVPLSMMGGFAANALLWLTVRIGRVFLPWHIEERLSLQSWTGVAPDIARPSPTPPSRYHRFTDR